MFLEGSQASNKGWSITGGKRAGTVITFSNGASTTKVTLTGVVFEELEVLRQVLSVGSSRGWNREQLGLTRP